MPHDSASDEQRAVEPLIRAGVSKAVGVELVPQSLRLEHGARVDVDGVAADGSILVEIYAHQGRRLKGAQFHKVARDALKLATLGRNRPRSRLVIAFADDDAAAFVTGTSWLAEALRAFAIEVVVVELDDDVRAGLRAAQVRQVMVNPGAASPERGAVDDSRA